MSLVLKSNSTFRGTELAKGYTAYVDRVTADGGQVFSKLSLEKALIFASSLGIDKNNGYSITSASWGFKASGGNLLKLYSLFGAEGDIVVTKGAYTLSVANGKQRVVSIASTTASLNTLTPITENNFAVITSVESLAPITSTRNIFGLANPTTNDRLMFLFVSANQVGSYYDSTLNSAISGELTVENKPFSVAAVKNGGLLSTYLNGNMVSSSAIRSETTIQGAVFYPVTAFNGASGGLSGYVHESWVLEEGSIEQVEAVIAYLNNNLS